MADTKISALTSATPVGTDETVIVDDPGGTPSSKRVTLDSVLAIAHTHAQSDVTNLTTDLAAKAALAGSTFTGLVQFSGTNHYGLKLITLTTVQRDGLTPSAGTVIYNSTTGNIEGYDGTSWLDLGAAAGAAGDLWSDPVDADIVPDTDSTWDLGSPTVRFAVLHVDQIDLAGTSLDGTSIPLTDCFEFVIDGGGSTITTGVKGYLEVPFACTISAVRLLADQSGSIVVDIWKDTYANYPPLDADSITASAVPTITTATKSEDTTLTGWTTSLAAGDILGFNVDSVTTITRVTVSLTVAL